MAEGFEMACRLTSPELGQRLDDLRTGLFTQVTAVDWQADGATFQFPQTDTVVNDLLDFVRFERQCCPFLDFALTFPAGESDARLTLTCAADGGETFIRQTFGPLTPEGFLQ